MLPFQILYFILNFETLNGETSDLAFNNTNMQIIFSFYIWHLMIDKIY